MDARTRTAALAGVAFALTALLTACGSTAEVDAPPAKTHAAEPPAEPVAKSPAEPAAEPVAEPNPRALNADGLLGGNATVTDYDVGEQGKVSVVRVGRFDADSGTLPFVFRNNTPEAVSHVDASATVRDAGRALVATGTSQGTVPAQIPPGGLGLAYLYLAGEVPDGATFEFTFDTSPADTSFYNTGDLRVTETSATDDGVFGHEVIGTAENQTDATLTGPYSADVYCFDETGTPLSTTLGFANESNDVAPGGTVSFSVSLYDDQCPTFLVGVSGYFS